MMRIFLLLLTTFSFLSVSAQNVDYVRTMIDSLCAPRYHGRGYVQHGDTKAAQFIVRQLEALGSAQKPELLDFSLSVNTFPGAMLLQLDGQVLTPGLDYIIDPKSSGVDGTFEAVYFNPKWARTSEKLFEQVASEKFVNKFVVLEVNEDEAGYKTLLSGLYKDPLRAAGYLVLSDQKLTWSVSQSAIGSPIFYVNSSKAGKKIKAITAKVDQVLVPDYHGKNVMVSIPGTDKTEKKKIVFTAHLDHLGRMGEETYIPGANDNASGSAMMLDLFHYYLQHPMKQEVVFIWFGGEEAGLVGSKAFVSDPPFPLDEIQFLMNLDLMGDAKTGITVVNGKVFDQHFARLSSLNQELGLLENVLSRGAAANSDHHPFYEKGVPCFFIYTTGDYKHYHDVNDQPENLPMTNYDKVFELIRNFMETGI
jgi:aminopeptidase YwaD